MKKDQAYSAVISDNSGICYQSFEYVIFLTESVHIRGWGFTTKKEAKTAAGNVARMLEIKIRWKKEA